MDDFLPRLISYLEQNAFYRGNAPLTMNQLLHICRRIEASANSDEESAAECDVGY